MHCEIHAQKAKINALCHHNTLLSWRTIVLQNLMMEAPSFCSIKAQLCTEELQRGF